MRVVALVSGGKDSCYNLLQCVAAGHEIVALANLQPDSSADELDSFMYQTVGHQGVSLYAEAMGLPLFRYITSGVAHHHHKWYTPTEGDEVEDLYKLLEKVKDKVNIDAVASGAVLSDYQRLRVENVCSRLGLVSLAYLWRRDQGELLKEMIDCDVDAVVIKVAALGLDPTKHLGMHLPEIHPHLLKMNEKYGLNICGEGGEYETFTLDCPFFRKRINIDAYETVIHSDDAIAPVGYLNFRKLSLIDKCEDNIQNKDLSKCIAPYTVKGPLEYISDVEVLDDKLLNGSDCEETEHICGSMKDVFPPQDISVQDRYDGVIFQNETGHACTNSSGWCWISSLVGNNTDPSMALTVALNNLLELLTQRQYSTSDLVAVTLFVQNMDAYVKMNSAYTNIINELNAPVRICVEVPLPLETAVIMEAVAYKPIENSPSHMESRRTMHVQSISHWAPASIGPYSQAIKVDDLIYVAGQIALVPGTMQLLDSGIRQQCRLALRHVSRIIKSMDQNILMRDIVQSTCYVTSSDYIRPARQEWERKSNNAIVDYVVVSKLPRDAKVEWHVWAHRGNSRFQYEETGCRIDRTHKMFLRRRFNYENTAAVVVCHFSTDIGASIEGDIANVSEEPDHLDENHIKQVITYTLGKLMSGEPAPVDLACNLRIFYCINHQSTFKLLYSVLSKTLLNTTQVSYTLIPVLQLNQLSTILSLSAIRHC